MKSLDTNALLWLLLADNPQQTTTVEALLSDKSQKFAVADMVFAEVVWVLQGGVYKYNRQRVAANLQAVIAIQQINCNKVMLENAIPLYVRLPKISFIDACLTIYAELDGALPLLTFNKKLAAAPPKSVKVLWTTLNKDKVH